MMAGSIFLGISYGLAIFIATRNSRWYVLAVLGIVLVCLPLNRDALLFSYPLLVGIVCLQLVNGSEKTEAELNWSLASTAFLFLPFGLLPLTKGSALFLCGPVALLSAGLFVSYRLWLHTIIVIVAPVVAMVVCWLLTGQSLADLPSYFTSLAPIVSGYTEAMSISGRLLEIGFYLVSSFALLAGTLVADQVPRKSRLFLLSLFGVFLFISFKAGFVRHDWHAIISGTSILLAALFFCIYSNSKTAIVVLSLALITWGYIAAPRAGISPRAILVHLDVTYSSAWHGLTRRLFENNSLADEFRRTIEIIHAKGRFPLLPGSTDIYSYNQSYLIASGNHWNPRPTLQSYSAYTPSLVEANKQHLLGEQAPDNVFFKVEPIDKRIPSIEDGASWPILLTNYRRVVLYNDFLLLHRQSSSTKVPTEDIVDSGSYAFGEAVPVPKVPTLIFAEISIETSVAGKLISTLYQPSYLQISLLLENGTKKSYRMIAGMAKSGLLLSPLIETTKEFSYLYQEIDLLSGKRVKAFSVVPVASKRWLGLLAVSRLSELSSKK
jgi:hypothetical protein